MFSTLRAAFLAKAKLAKAKLAKAKAKLETYRLKKCQMSCHDVICDMLNMLSFCHEVSVCLLYTSDAADE